MTRALRVRSFPCFLLLFALIAPAWGDDAHAQARSATRDAERYATYVHPDFTQFGENDPYLASGKALEVQGMTSYLRRASGVRTNMHQPEVTVRGDVAWITYYWTDEGVSEGKRFTSRGKSTRIFVRENGRWLCIHGHYTALP